jgi:aryl-alcohol dehydrogenase-like predicted oxidoreductase
MQPRKLGSTGLEVSPLGLGCMGMSYSYGPPKDKREMASLLAAAVERGVMFFDTAEVYGPYTNEELVGEALAPFRGQVVIATKFGFDLDTPPDLRGTKGAPTLNSRPAHIVAAVEGSLRRLRVECIDLLYQHRVDPAGAHRGCGRRREAAHRTRARSEALRIVGGRRASRSAGRTPCSRSTALQNEYSLLAGATPEAQEVIPVLEELGIGLVPYSAARASGYLTGRHRRRRRPSTPPTSAARLPRFAPAKRCQANQAAGRIAITRLAARKGATPAQVALAWLLAQRPWVVPIPGTTRLDRLEENLGALRVSLAADDLAEIDRAAAAITVVGERYPERLEKMTGR